MPSRSSPGIRIIEHKLSSRVPTRERGIAGSSAVAHSAQRTIAPRAHQKLFLPARSLRSRARSFFSQHDRSERAPEPFPPARLLHASTRTFSPCTIAPRAHQSFFSLHDCSMRAPELFLAARLFHAHTRAFLPGWERSLASFLLQDEALSRKIAVPKIAHTKSYFSGDGSFLSQLFCRKISVRKIARATRSTAGASRIDRGRAHQRLSAAPRVSKELLW